MAIHRENIGTRNCMQSRALGAQRLGGASWASHLPIARNEYKSDRSAILLPARRPGRSYSENWSVASLMLVLIAPRSQRAATSGRSTASIAFLNFLPGILIGVIRKFTGSIIQAGDVGPANVSYGPVKESLAAWHGGAKEIMAGIGTAMHLLAMRCNATVPPRGPAVVGSSAPFPSSPPSKAVEVLSPMTLPSLTVPIPCIESGTPAEQPGPTPPPRCYVLERVHSLLVVRTTDLLPRLPDIAAVLAATGVIVAGSAAPLLLFGGRRVATPRQSRS